MSERFACRVLGQHRSTQRKVPRGRADEDALTADIIALASQYLTWLLWYCGVVEPVCIAAVLGVADHPVAQATFRDRDAIAARLIPALEGRDWLVNDSFSAADIVLCSTYLYFPDATPGATSPTCRSRLSGSCRTTPASRARRSAGTRSRTSSTG